MNLYELMLLHQYCYEDYFVSVAACHVYLPLFHKELCACVRMDKSLNHIEIVYTFLTAAKACPNPWQTCSCEAIHSGSFPLTLLLA